MGRIIRRASRVHYNPPQLEVKHSLFKFISFLYLFALIADVLPHLNAQTRPRRVGDKRSSQIASPLPDTMLPPAPPVLRGANSSAQQVATQNGPATKQGPEEVGAGDIIRVNTTLVTIPVSVMDRDGKYIPNLRKEDFRIWDDGVEQRAAYFASTEQPFTVVLMIDTSGSTHFKLEEMQDAAIAFVNQLQPDDRVMVVSFDDKIRFLKDPPTNDRQALRQAILRTRTGGGTRLYDAVDQVINQHLNNIQGRKAIVLFTDGVDTTSRTASYEDNVRDSEELDALIYPVQFDTYGDMNMGGPWPGLPRRFPSSRPSILGRIILGGGIGWPGDQLWCQVVGQVRVVKTIEGETNICTISLTVLARAYTMQIRISRTRLLKWPKSFVGSTVWVTTLKHRGNLESVIKSRFARTVLTWLFEHATATSTKILPVSRRRIHNRLLPSYERVLSFTRIKDYARDVRPHRVPGIMHTSEAAAS